MHTNVRHHTPPAARRLNNSPADLHVPLSLSPVSVKFPSSTTTAAHHALLTAQLKSMAAVAAANGSGVRPATGSSSSSSPRRSYTSVLAGAEEERKALQNALEESKDLLEDERRQSSWLRRENRRLRALLLLDKGSQTPCFTSQQLDWILTHLEQQHQRKVSALSASHGEGGDAAVGGRLTLQPSNVLKRRLDMLSAQHGMPASITREMASLDEEIQLLAEDARTLRDTLNTVVRQRDEAVGHIVQMDSIIQKLQVDLVNVRKEATLAGVETSCPRNVLSLSQEMKASDGGAGEGHHSAILPPSDSAALADSVLVDAVEYFSHHPMHSTVSLPSVALAYYRAHHTAQNRHESVSNPSLPADPSSFAERSDCSTVWANTRREVSLVQMLHFALSRLRAHRCGGAGEGGEGLGRALLMDENATLKRQLEAALADVTAAAETASSSILMMESLKRERDELMFREAERVASLVDDAMFLEGRMRSQIVDRAVGGFYALLATCHFPSLIEMMVKRSSDASLLSQSQQQRSEQEASFAVSPEPQRVASSADASPWRQRLLTAELSSRFEDALALGADLALEVEHLESIVAEETRKRCAAEEALEEANRRCEAMSGSGRASSAVDEHIRTLEHIIVALEKEKAAAIMSAEASKDALASLQAQLEGHKLQKEATQQHIKDTNAHADALQAEVRSLQSNLSDLKATAAAEMSALRKAAAAKEEAHHAALRDLNQLLSVKTSEAIELSSQIAKLQMALIDGGSPRRGVGSRTPTPRCRAPAAKQSSPATAPAMPGAVRVSTNADVRDGGGLSTFNSSPPSEGDRLFFSPLSSGGSVVLSP